MGTKVFFSQGTLEDEIPFPKVRCVGFLEGILQSLEGEVMLHCFMGTVIKLCIPGSLNHGNLRS